MKKDFNIQKLIELKKLHLDYDKIEYIKKLLKYTCKQLFLNGVLLYKISHSSVFETVILNEEYEKNKNKIMQNNMQEYVWQIPLIDFMYFSYNLNYNEDVHKELGFDLEIINEQKDKQNITLINMKNISGIIGIRSLIGYNETIEDSLNNLYKKQYFNYLANINFTLIKDINEIDGIIDDIVIFKQKSNNDLNNNINEPYNLNNNYYAVYSECYKHLHYELLDFYNIFCLDKYAGEYVNIDQIEQIQRNNYFNLITVDPLKSGKNKEKIYITSQNVILGSQNIEKFYNYKTIINIWKLFMEDQNIYIAYYDDEEYEEKNLYLYKKLNGTNNTYEKFNKLDFLYLNIDYIFDLIRDISKYSFQLQKLSLSEEIRNYIQQAFETITKTKINNILPIIQINKNVIEVKDGLIIIQDLQKYLQKELQEEQQIKFVNYKLYKKQVYKDLLKEYKMENFCLLGYKKIIDINGEIYINKVYKNIKDKKIDIKKIIEKKIIEDKIKTKEQIIDKNEYQQLLGKFIKETNKIAIKAIKKQ